MSDQPPTDGPEWGAFSFEETVEYLQGLRTGIAGLLMPLSDGGWRVHYYSLPTFDNKPGTDFDSFKEAIAAIVEVLEFVNTPEERERARLELRDYLRGIAERDRKPRENTTSGELLE